MTTTKQIDLRILGSTGGGESWWTREQPEFGRTAIDQYSEMRDQSSVIGGTFLAFESLFRRVKWTEAPAPRPDGPKGAWTEARARYWAQFLTQCREDMSHTWPGFIAEVLSMLPFGWSYFEVVWKYRRGPDQRDARYRSRHADNLIGWRKISLRPQSTLSRWVFDGDGGIQGMYQTTSTGEVLIPIGRALHFRTTEAGNNPEGRSMLRNARRAYYFAKRLEEFEAVGVERNLSGIPMVEVPAAMLSADATEAERKAVAMIVEQAKALRRDEQAVVVVPSSTYIESVYDPKTDTSRPVELGTGFKFSLLGAPGVTPVDVNPIITRYKRDVALSLLSSFLMLGIDGKGSLALSTDLTDLFELAGTGILDGVAATFNRFAVAQLMQLNGVPPELWPTLEHGGLSDAALKGLITSLNGLLASGGITPDVNLETELREKLGVPKKAETANPAPAVQTGSGSGDGTPPQDGQPPGERQALVFDHSFQEDA
ncbi:phage portal protein family protein [Deinococcus aquiradiocola]|uniref:Portal protein n=1 Tax=Deinococcus aquiradiocola TaxID=393059 RepID=A0A917UL03_9DEIO|nr:hypothetical protein [Deinococcus aquiradiocola]GGJ65287.1 hypothetical protein GCM10008939_06500 [Deinococcus aquiradiocola]